LIKSLGGCAVAINTSPALHGTLAEGAQRIGEAVADRLSDPGECALSASAMTLGDDNTRIRLSVA
jgi:hypothetical protein